MSTLDVKLSHAATGETRVISLPVQPAPTWAELVQHIQQRFALTQSPTKVTYVDDDGDEITCSSDDELRELWHGSATEPNLSLTFDASVAPPVDDDEHEPVRDAEQNALLDSIRDALEKDASLAHDLRKVVHDVLGLPRHPHPHPYSYLAPHRGHGGRKGLVGARGRHHERWEMRSRSRTLEDDATSSSDSDSDMDRAGAGGRRSGRGGRRRGKYDGPSPPHYHFPGPPPPHPRRGRHGHRGTPMPPPPPGAPHGPPAPPFSFGFFGPPPPPPSPFPPHGHRHSMQHRPPPFFPPGPPPPPRHGPHDGAHPFAEQDPSSVAPWHALVDYLGSPCLGGPQHGRCGGAFRN